MDDHCLVICGDWRCRADENWEFVIDKYRMSRIVALNDGIRLCELVEKVLSEFGMRE